MISHSLHPHGLHRSHLISFSSFAVSACVWLVVAYKIFFYQQPVKASVYYIVVIFP